MATWEMYRPVNKAGSSAWVWATSEGEAARVFVAAGHARSLDGVVRCQLDGYPSRLVGRPARRADSLRVIDRNDGANLGPLAELEATGILAWVADGTDPHWLLQPIDLGGELEGPPEPPTENP